MSSKEREIKPTLQNIDTTLLECDKYADKRTRQMNIAEKSVDVWFWFSLLATIMFLALILKNV